MMRTFLKRVAAPAYLIGFACAVLVSPLRADEAASGALKSAWNVRDHIPLTDITVQSHRGAGKLAPENTVVAFKLAWKLNTVPEADLRMTRDDVIVAFHDSNFKRLVKDASPELKTKGIVDLTWDEVRQLDVGSWQGDEFKGCRVPSIDEIIGLLAEDHKRRLYLDIKNVDLARLAKLVHDAGVEPQVVLASTKYDMIRSWKKVAPAAGTLHWMGGTEEELAGRLKKLRETDFADITQLQIHVHTQETDQGKVLSPSESFLIKAGAELRKHDILFQSLPWGRSDAQVYWQLMDLGVASFATDYPDVTMKAIQDYYAKKR